MSACTLLHTHARVLLVACLMTRSMIDCSRGPVTALLAAGSVAITTSAMQVHFCFSCSRTSLSPLQPQNLAQACLPSPLASCLQLTLTFPCSTLISAWRAISWPTPLHSYSGSQENETQRLLEPEQVEKRLSRVCLPLRKRATLAILLAPDQVERF
jgi:hypothetical protein